MSRCDMLAAKYSEVPVSEPGRRSRGRVDGATRWATVGARCKAGWDENARTMAEGDMDTPADGASALAEALVA